MTDTMPQTLAVGDRVRIAHNYIYAGETGALGDQIVGLTGVIDRSGGLDRWYIKVDEDCRLRSLDEEYELHASSFEKIDANEPVPETGTDETGGFHSGDRVRIARNMISATAQGGLTRLVGLTGTIGDFTESPHFGPRWEITLDPDQPHSGPFRLHHSSFEKLDTFSVGDRAEIVHHILPNGEQGVYMAERIVGLRGTVVRVHDGPTFGPDYPAVHMQIDADSPTLPGNTTILSPRAYRKIEVNGSVPETGTEEVVLTAEDLPRIREAWGLTLPVVTLLDSISQNLDLIGDAAAEHEARKQRFQSVASKVANDEEWCPVFTKIMDDFGMEREDGTSEHEAEWWTRVTISINHSISDDDAAEIVSNYYDLGGEDVTIPGYTTVEAEVRVEVRGTRDRSDNECFCDEVDTDDVEALLPHWYDSDNMSFEEGTIYCDHD